MASAGASAALGSISGGRRNQVRAEDRPEPGTATDAGGGDVWCVWRLLNRRLSGNLRPILLHLLNLLLLWRLRWLKLWLTDRGCPGGKCRWWPRPGRHRRNRVAFIRIALPANSTGEHIDGGADRRLELDQTTALVEDYLVQPHRLDSSSFGNPVVDPEGCTRLAVDGQYHYALRSGFCDATDLDVAVRGGTCGGDSAGRAEKCNCRRQVGSPRRVAYGGARRDGWTRSKDLQRPERANCNQQKKQ
jgi:hypothetical protein